VSREPDQPPIRAVPDAEAHHHLLEFLRGVSRLDLALGPWRPDYGGLPARAEAEPAAIADLGEAHRLYAQGLGFFAAHPDAIAGLGGSADDVTAAIADAGVRFGVPIIPLEALLYAREAPAGGGAEAEDGVARPAPVSGARPAAKAAPPIAGDGWGRRPPPPARGLTGAEAPPRRSRLAAWVGLGSLIVIVLIVAAILVLSHSLFLSSGPNAGPPPTTPAPATLPSSALSPGPLPSQVLAAAQACSNLPSGQVPPGLAIASASSGIGTDPRTGYGTSSVAVTLGQAVGPGTPATDLIAAVLPGGAASPGTGQPVDRAGSIQLIAYWDGRHWYAALRTWSGSAWSAPSSSSSPPVDVTQVGRVVTLYWQGLATGYRYGVIVATAGGCAATDLSSSFAPTQSYGS
jgi:hypothetical protein